MRYAILMKKIIFSLLFLITQSALSADIVLDEIKSNLEESSKKIEAAKKQISSLEENSLNYKKNIETLGKSLGEKKSERKEAMETLADYNQKLGATSLAKREFEKSLEKDAAELDLVEKDILAVQRKLVALEAAKKALQESIEISEENLSKMSDRTGSWQKNKNHLTTELKAIETDLSQIEQQIENQEKLRTENQQKLNTWKKSIGNFENSHQKLEQKYRSALKEAERKKESNH